MAEQRPNAILFHGRGGELFGKYLVNIILSVLTLGIYSFWGKVKILQYQYAQTQLGGSPFEFHGTGKELFFAFLKFLGILIVFEALVIGLSLVPLFVPDLPETAPLGITILVFAVILLFTLVLVPIASNSRLRYRLSRSSWRGLFGRYSGANKELIALFAKGLGLTVITLGIYGSWFTVRIRRYIFERLHFSGLDFGFSGKGSELFLLSLRGILLSIITLGIYSFWFGRDLYRWYSEKTFIRQQGTDWALSSQVTPGKLFQLWIPNALLLVVTLGIAYPWIVVRNLRFFWENLILPDQLNLEALEQGASQTGNALGENFGDFLDLGDFGIL